MGWALSPTRPFCNRSRSRTGRIFAHPCKKSIPGNGSLFPAFEQLKISSTAAVLPVESMPREELVNAFTLCEGPSPTAILDIPCPSPAPRSQPAALADSAFIATHHPQPSHPSPLAASPNDLRTGTSIHAPASAARFRGKISLRADLGHASYVSSPASISGTPSICTHPTTGSAPSSPALPRKGQFSKPVQVRGKFSMRGELIHVFLSYRFSAEGPGANGLSGLLAQRIRSLSMHERALQLPQHGW